MQATDARDRASVTKQCNLVTVEGQWSLEDKRRFGIAPALHHRLLVQMPVRVR